MKEANDKAAAELDRKRRAEALEDPEGKRQCTNITLRKHTTPPCELVLRSAVGGEKLVLVSSDSSNKKMAKETELMRWQANTHLTTRAPETAYEYNLTPKTVVYNADEATLMNVAKCVKNSASTQVFSYNSFPAGNLKALVPDREGVVYRFSFKDSMGAEERAHAEAAVVRARECTHAALFWIMKKNEKNGLEPRGLIFMNTKQLTLLGGGEFDLQSTS